MEIEKEGKSEKKKFSLFCCFSSNCGRSNSRRKEQKNNQKTASTTGIKSNNSIQNNSRPNVKEFSMSNDKENKKNEIISPNKNSDIVIGIYSNKDNPKSNKKDDMNEKNTTNNKNIHSFVKENNNMILSLISSKLDVKNKSIIENNYKNKIVFGSSKSNNQSNNSNNKTNKTINNKSNNNFSCSENSIKKNIIEEDKEKIINDECIKYEMTSNDGINDNVNIYDNNNMSYNIYNNNENEQKNEQKNLNTAKDSYIFNNNFKHNYYPTDFNLNLSSDIKKNNQINSVININQKLNLSNLNLNNDINITNTIQNKDDTIIIKSEGINQINEIKNLEINPVQFPTTKYKLNYSKSLNNLNDEKIHKNNLYNLYKLFLEDINISNRSGIFFIQQNYLNDLNDDHKKIRFGFKYSKARIKIKQNILDEPLYAINKEKTITFHEKINKSQNNNFFFNNNNNLLDNNSDNNKNDELNPIISKSQKDIDNIEEKLNYINDNYFEGNNTNIISNIANNNINNETNKEKENLDNNTNINNPQLNKENEEEKDKLNDNLTKKEELSKNKLDFEGDIEEADIEEEGSKKINDTKSIMSNYIISPLIGNRGLPGFTPHNLNVLDSKENFSNFNEIMSNKGSFFPPNISNYNETEIEIINENGKEFSSFIETPRASGVYNERVKISKNDYFNMNNTYNYKNMNIKMKKVRDKINQNAKEIQKVNEKINKLDEKIKEYENCNKQYDIWIEKEEEESEMLINMLNFLNSNRK